MSERPDPLLQGRQGPSDWHRETASDDQLSPTVRERIARLVEALLGLLDRPGG